MKNYFASLVVLAVLAAGGCAQREEAGGAHAGASAADFQAALAQPGLLFVDFYATWCGPCRAMKPVVAQAEKDYAGRIRFMEIDVDQNQALAGEYKVESIPAFYVFKDGKPLDGRVGAMPADELKKWLDGFVEAAK